MRLAVTAFFMAWGMFWIVPCPLKWWDERARIGMLLFLPAIGALIGLVWAICAFLAERYIPGKIAAALLASAPYVLSGFIHLDGYMDCADAVLSRRDLETRRKILKDSHIGSFAAVALVILFLTEYAAFAGYDLGRKVWLLPLVCAGPRALCSCCVLGYEPIPGSSYERMFSGGVPLRAKYCAMAVLAAVVVLPPVFLGVNGLCSAVGALGAFLTIAYIRHDLGGMSGDVSGAGTTVGELCALIALVLL